MRGWGSLVNFGADVPVDGGGGSEPPPPPPPPPLPIGFGSYWLAGYTYPATSSDAIFVDRTSSHDPQDSGECYWQADETQDTQEIRSYIQLANGGLPINTVTITGIIRPYGGTDGYAVPITVTVRLRVAGAPVYPNHPLWEDGVVVATLNFDTATSIPDGDGPYHPFIASFDCGGAAFPVVSFQNASLVGSYDDYGLFGFPGYHPAGTSPRVGPGAPGTGTTSGFIVEHMVVTTP